MVQLHRSIPYVDIGERRSPVRRDFEFLRLLTSHAAEHAQRVGVEHRDNLTSKRIALHIFGLVENNSEKTAHLSEGAVSGKTIGNF